VQQGGTRSGKTYNILLWIIFDYCDKNTGKMVTIVRKSFPAVRGTVMRDFFQILNDHGIYSESLHSKSESTYIINGNTIEFISLDMPQKIRGRKRDLLFINEANELEFDAWQQLIFRTSDKAILDYNPSDEFHWIYDKVLSREDVAFFKTTYLDNPFLNETIKQEIERLKIVDENYWRIYGLGERGQSRSLVFNYSEIQAIPDTAKHIGYGMDFGFAADPTTLIEVRQDGDNLYFDEMLYRTGMTNRDITNMLRSLSIDQRAVVWADSSEPKSIYELHQSGFNVRGTKKGADSINMGIDIMRRYKLHITHRSLNLIKEFRNYKYIEDKDGRVTNKPIDAFNHGIDAARYAIFNTMSRPNFGKYAIK
jgi:phage terminase large subunit